MMRIRLFWQILATFALLLMFAIGGIAVVLGLTLQRIGTSNAEQPLEQQQRAWSGVLGDYYVAHHSNWTGVQDRLDALRISSTWGFPTPLGYRLLDAQGNVVAASLGQQRGEQEASGTPISANGVTVGRLVLGYTNWGPQTAGHNQNEQATTDANFNNTTIGRDISRGFRWAALSIGGTALALAALMSRRISAPLQALTRAAQQVALGQPVVQVRGSSIREVATLSGAFNQMASDIAHADQLRRNMTADIAHELRTPLTIIKGKLEGVLDGVYPATPAHLEPVLEEANLLERLIDDLRLLSLAEAGQLPLHPEALAVDDLLAVVKRTFGSAAAAQRVMLTVQAVPDLPPIKADEQRMQQVLGNLIANSLRHTPAGGRIELRADTVGQRVRIVISDTGSGIAPQELEHIFDRFWRGDRARTRQGSGAGLGLAIARQFVHAQGGTIHAASESDKGTTITLEFPVAAGVTMDVL